MPCLSRRPPVGGRGRGFGRQFGQLALSARRTSACPVSARRPCCRRSADVAALDDDAETA